MIEGPRMRYTLPIFAAALALSGCVTSNIYDVAADKPKLEFTSTKDVTAMSACLQRAYGFRNPAEDLSHPYQDGRAIFGTGVGFTEVHPTPAGSRVLVKQRGAFDKADKRAKACMDG